MSTLRRLLCHSPWHYAAAAALGVVLTLLGLLRGGFTLRISWADSLTVAGAVVMLVGMLGWVSYLGAFDIFGYSFSILGNRRCKNLYEYSQLKRQKRTRRGWTFVPYLVVGAVLLLAGLAVWA